MLSSFYFASVFLRARRTPLPFHLAHHGYDRRYRLASSGAVRVQRFKRLQSFLNPLGQLPLLAFRQSLEGRFDFSHRAHVGKVASRRPVAKPALLSQLGRRKRWRATAIPDAGSVSNDARTSRSVVEYASPLALWMGTEFNAKTPTYLERRSGDSVARRQSEIC